MNKRTHQKTKQNTIYELSERLVKAQKPIRILDSIKWNKKIEHEFFQHQGKKEPNVSKAYYEDHALKFKPDHKREEFLNLERDIKKQLGQFSGIGNIMLRMCREYRTVIRMLEARGTKEFSRIAQDLYGSGHDAFYPGGPTLSELSLQLSQALKSIDEQTDGLPQQDLYTAQQATRILKKRLSEYFYEDYQRIKITVDDGIFSDAAAGAEKLKLRKASMFSDRDIKMLEVHEGWTHIGTTINGLDQPYCTFLSKGPPSSTIYQEGLAIILEIFNFASSPERIRKLNNRVITVSMAEEGASFIDIYRYYLDQGISAEASYIASSRVFRGSTPTLGPFTKDLSYSKGFILIYNFIRLAIEYGYLNRIPFLFLGKTTIDDLKTYEALVDEGIIVYPKYIPKPFEDIVTLASWMSYSLLLNKINLDELAKNYFTII